MNKKNIKAITLIKNLIEEVAEQLESGKIPSISVKTRTKNNIFFDTESRVWKLGDKKTIKTAKTIGGSKEVLRVLNMLLYLLEQLQVGKTSTCRQLYYVALNWIEESRFEEQSDSNTALENIEILTGLLREELGIVPDFSGNIFGPVVVNTNTRSGFKKVDCQKDVGEAGYPIPPKVEDYELLSTTAKFLLVIETGGMYQRLVEDRFDEKFGCILIHTHGQPSRATRIFVKRMYDKYHLPIFTFADADPWGIGISENIATGSIKSVHLSERLCSPDLIHIGLTSTQIEEYNLPTDKLTPREEKRIQEMLEDPRYKQKPEIIRQLLHMKQRKLKAEQQSLAIKGLSYVTDHYLPEVLANYQIYPVI